MNLTKLKWFTDTVLTRWQYGNVGRHSYIGKTLFVQRKKNLFVGENTRIYPGMRAEMVEDSASVKIGDNVSIGQNFHVVSNNTELRIGNNVTISANVFVSNVNHDYHEIDVHSLEQKLIPLETSIGDYCFIGYGAVILPGTRLGKQCIVGANSVVKGEFPDYCVIAGSPAKIIKQYDHELGTWKRV